MKKARVFVGDFETTVFEGQQDTEVWASACVEMFTEDVRIFHSIDETFDYFVSLKSSIIVYYHNLKFDGSFWLHYLLYKRGFKQGFDCIQLSEDVYEYTKTEDKDLKNNMVNYTINNMGNWYKIVFKVNNKTIELRDSLKLLPFTVERIGKAFATKHKKLDMEYKGFRFAGCKISDKEKEYIANDVLVVKEALEIMIKEGHDKLTIGACCLSEFKKEFSKKTYNDLFPNLYEITLDKELYGAETADEYVRKSYRGGWTYLARGKENKIYHNGTTADVNSLYPSMMSSESGNYYPVGLPHFWKGNFIPPQATYNGRYYFIRIKCRFRIKKMYLPSIQIKNSFLYNNREMLITSDIYSPKDNKYHTQYIDKDGNTQTAYLTMTMTMTDYKLFHEHYNVYEEEILDGCYFEAQKGLFDLYMEKYKKIKMNSTGAMRELAKLFLNNLYGKMASNNNSSYKVTYLKDDMSLGFYEVPEYEKKSGYIPIGSAITSYARNFTIRAAQANYHGVNERGFIYADTDSIHCDLDPDEIIGIKEDSKEFCCWKLESCWDTAYFARAKTYIEHITHENREKIDKEYYNIKCAGMTERCKELFEKSMTGYEILEEEYEQYTDEEIEFIETKRDITDFKIGLRVPSKLVAKNIKGGILLVETTYEMR